MRLLRAMVLIGVVAITAFAATERSVAKDQLPLRGIEVRIQQDGREALFDELGLFADRFAFAMRIGRVRPDKPSFLIQMWREDVKLIGTNASENIYKIFFYENGDSPIPGGVLDYMADDLQKALENLDGASVELK
jgi:hypothetical protein